MISDMKKFCFSKADFRILSKRATIWVLMKAFLTEISARSLESERSWVSCRKAV